MLAPSRAVFVIFRERITRRQGSDGSKATETNWGSTELRKKIRSHCIPRGFLKLQMCLERLTGSVLNGRQ